MRDRTQSRIARWLARDPGLAFAILATLIAIAIYAPTLGTDLVGYDDTWLVGDNYVVRDASWSSVSTIFFDLDSPRRFTLAPEYLPVRDLSVMLDFVIWGDAYGGHHATNLVLYLAAIWLWFGALVGFGIDRKVAGIAILIWAVHPSHAESVAWLAERKGLLGVVFAGATGLAYARFRAGGRAAWLVGAMLLAVLAVWSKAHAAFAVAALAGLELALPERRASPRRSMIGLGAIAVVGLAAFVPVLVLALSSAVVGHEAAPVGRAAMVVGTHGFYVRMAVMAFPNAVSYPFSITGPTVIDDVLGVAAFMAVTAVVVRHRRMPTALRAGCVLWVFGWIPVSHLVLPLEMVFVADRYLLIPSLGFAVALAVGVTRIAKPRLGYTLLAVIVLAGTVRSLDAQASWRNSEMLWERAVASNPADGAAWSAYAEAIAATDPERALAIVDQGLAHGRHRRLLLRRALVLTMHGDRTLGLAAMREAAEAGEPRAMSDLALMLLADHELDEALRWARRGAAASKVYEPGYRALGTVALAARQFTEARTAFTSAYELAPKSCTNAYNLALAELELGQLDAAASRLAPCEADPVLARRVRSALAEIARRRP